MVFGVGASFLVLFANGAAITQAAAATALLAGVLAGATAAGVTEVQRKADAMKDARVQLRQVEFRTQGRDHPILLAAPETQYLKCGIYQVFK